MDVGKGQHDSVLRHRHEERLSSRPNGVYYSSRKAAGSEAANLDRSPVGADLGHTRDDLVATMASDLNAAPSREPMFLLLTVRPKTSPRTSVTAHGLRRDRGLRGVSSNFRRGRFTRFRPGSGVQSCVEASGHCLSSATATERHCFSTARQSFHGAMMPLYSVRSTSVRS